MPGRSPDGPEDGPRDATQARLRGWGEGERYWVYRRRGAEHPRLDHLSWDRVVLPADHPFWAQHYPPNGWGCGCKVYGAHSPEGARRRGGDPGKALPEGWDRIDSRTGAQAGIGKGWGYMPGASSADEINIIRDKLPKLPAPIGAAWFANLPARRLTRMQEDFAAFVDRSLSNRPEKNFMVVGALKPSWIAAADKAGVAIESAEIAATDSEIQHTFRGTPQVTAPSTRAKTGTPKVEPLDLAWYKGLVRHLLSPEAVLLDRRERTPALLLVYSSEDDRNAKLVLQLNVPVKKAKGVMNTLHSGRFVMSNDLYGDEQSPLVEVIDGVRWWEPGRT